jgi:uncharacterized protein YciI
MDDLLYVMLLEKTKIYKKMNKAAAIRHVDNIRRLDDDGNLELCGVLRKCPGYAGLVIIRAGSYEEAEELCKREPMVTEGYATYKLMSLQVGNRENNYLI